MILVNNLPRNSPNSRNWLNNLDAGSNGILHNLTSPFHGIYDGIAHWLEQIMWFLVLVFVLVCLTLSHFKVGAFLVQSMHPQEHPAGKYGNSTFPAPIDH